MIFLLDVNALIALGFRTHALHDRMVAWLQTQKLPTFATCAITELGFVRVLAQTPAYNLTVDEAKALLTALKGKATMKFLVDAVEASALPSWVRSGRQTTDGHLLQLAAAHGAALATFDAQIPGAHLIP